MIRPRFGLAALAVVAASVAAAATSQTPAEPLSVIDWLSRSVEDRVRPGDAAMATGTGAAVPPVTTTALAEAGPAALGALSPETAGLPADLWSADDIDRIETLLAEIEGPTLPALTDLLVRLVLSSAVAPDGATGRLMQARVDTLLRLGLLPQALALLEASDPVSGPALFRRWFDASLLTGSEDRTCVAMQSNPALAPTVPARVFCQARSGDWPGAALTLNTHRALGDLDGEEETLLVLFLDPELAEEAEDTPAGAQMTPLDFRMRRAIGAGVATGRLPLAFAHADLEDTVGVKTRLEAAERLARHGALPAPALAQLFLSGRPSASGGTWDLMRALQTFDAAVADGDSTALSEALPPLWDQLAAIRAEPLLAELYPDPLPDLDATAEPIAVRLANLAGRAPEGTPPLVAALIDGDPAGVETRDSIEQAIVTAFAEPAPPVADGTAGAHLLAAIAQLEAAVAGDAPAITEGLVALRSAGQEATARRLAVQLLILDRRT